MKYINSIILGLLLGYIVPLYPVNAFSQDSEINPYRQAALKDSIKKLDSLVQLTMISNPVLCMKNAQKALNYAHRLKTAEDLIHGYSLMGQAFFKKDKDSSYIYLNKALKLADSAKIDAQKPLLLFNIASIHYIAKDFNGALRILDTCIKVARSQGDYANHGKGLQCDWKH